MDEELIGNITTIIMFIFSTCGGGAIIECMGGSSQAVIIIGAIVGLLYSFINAYFPNGFEFLNNNKKSIDDIAEYVTQCDDCDCEKNDDC